MVTNPDIRAAAAFLAKQQREGISPRKLAAASKETGKSFAELLRLIGLLQSGGQGQSARREEVIGAVDLKNSQLAQDIAGA